MVFVLSIMFRLALGPTLASTGYSCSFLGVEQLWHEVDHSPPSGAEVKPLEP